MVRSALWIVVGALCATALTAIVVLITGRFDETGARVLGVALTMAGFSLTALAGATLSGRRPGSWLGAATIGCSVVGMGLFGALIAGIADFRDDALTRAAYVSLVLAGSGAQASLVQARGLAATGLDQRARGRLMAVAWATTTMIGTVAALAVVVVAGINEVPSPGYWRALGVFAVLDVLGTLLVPVLRWIWRSSGRGSFAGRGPATSE